MALPKPRVRVYIASSFDGFIADEEGGVDWLHQERSRPGAPPPDPDAIGFDAFMADVGCMLMGRATYDTVAAFDAWPYGDTPVLVATRRPLEPLAPTVRAVAGDIGALVSEAKRLAVGGDVYLDGGNLVHQALAAAVVDEMIVTFVPVLLGRGIPLFAGLDAPRDVQLGEARRYEHGMLQVTVQL